VKYGLQQEKFEKKYESYPLNDDKLLIYKNKILIPNSSGLIRTIINEIHKCHILDIHVTRVQ
jgi:hypothetical protein